MTQSLQDLLQLFVKGFRAPRDAATGVLGLGLTSAQLLPLAGLVSILLAFFRFAQFELVGPVEIQQPDGSVEALSVEPMFLAVFLYLSMVLAGWMMGTFGRRLGGTGSNEHALSIAVFVNILAAGLNLVILAAIVILPGLAVLVALAGYIALIWTTIQLTDVLHGFGSNAKAMVLLITVATGIVLGLMTLATLFGGFFGAR